MSGYNNPDTRRCRRGGNCADFQHSAANPLAFCSNRSEIRAARQSVRARKAKTTTLLRTSTAASLSGAYAPSCGAGSVLPAPISWTCEDGTRVCGFFSYFSGGMSAFPSLLQAVQKSVRSKPLNLFTSARYFKSPTICLPSQVLTYPHRDPYVRSPNFSRLN